MKTKYLSIVLLLVFVLMFQVLSFAVPANTAVTLFTDVNQSGTPTYLTLGNYNLPALETLGYINDSAKSVKIYSLKYESTPTPEPLITPTPTPTPEPELPPTGGGGEYYMGFVILICLVLFVNTYFGKI